MSTRVVINLPDEVYHQAERLARAASREVADILVDTVMVALPPFTQQPETAKAVTELSDEEVLTLTELQMEPRQDRRLSALLERQQAGGLTHEEHAELLVLMQLYQEGLLRKAQALHEAVRRGLRQPLEP